MNSICTHCHYIGEAKQGPIHTYKFPLAGLFIGISVSSLVALLTIELPASYFYAHIAVVIFTFILGIYLLISDHRSSKLNTNSKRTKPSLAFLLLGIFLILWSLLIFYGDTYLKSRVSSYDPVPLGNLAPVILFIFGAITLHFYSKDNTICPNCDKKKTMIAIDNPLAKDIIQQNNLSVPE